MLNLFWVDTWLDIFILDFQCILLPYLPMAFSLPVSQSIWLANRLVHLITNLESTCPSPSEAVRTTYVVQSLHRVLQLLVKVGEFGGVRSMVSSGVVSFKE
jgi:hypothetical protein